MRKYRCIYKKVKGGKTYIKEVWAENEKGALKQCPEYLVVGTVKYRRYSGTFEVTN